MVNINNIVVKGVHSPNVDNYPLYATVDGYNGENQGKTDKWFKMSQSHFNSPTNVRHIVMTNKKIIVELYKGIYENGKLTKKVLTKSVEPLDEYAQCLCLSEPMSKLEYKATGTGLKALVRPWVTTNIETLYFDWMCLLDADIVSLIGLDKIKAVLAKQAILSKQDILSIFCNEIRCVPEGISEKFPRLHKIGFSFDLEMCIDTKINMGLISQLEKQGNISVVKINTARKSKFSIRDGIYRYDDLVLSKYVDDFTTGKSSQKIKKLESVTPIVEETITPNRPTEKSKEEKLLFSIYSKTGYDGLRKALEMCDNSLMGKLTQEGYDLCQKALSR